MNNTFITAKEAFKMSDENSKKELHPKMLLELNEIFEKISKATELGDFSINIPNEIRSDTRQFLADKGYVLENNYSSTLTQQLIISSITVSWDLY